MAGKRDGGRDGVEALTALTDEILDPIAGADLDEMERRLKLATASVKLRQALVETLTKEMQLHGEDEALDAAGEERLREELYRRLVALAQAIDAEEAAEGDPAGAGRPGRSDRPDGRDTETDLGADLDETERRLKLATLSVKLRQMMVDAAVRDAQLESEDETLDAAGEERLRAELYDRLVSLARAIDEDEAAEADPARAGSADRNGLEPVGPSATEAAQRHVEQLVVPWRPWGGKNPGRG